jgi:ribosome-associated protein
MSTTDARQQIRLLVQAAAAVCEDKKGEDTRILELDPADSGLSDFFLITSATNDRQCVAIADEIEFRLKKEFGVYANSVEGRNAGQWILLDYVDFVVHVFLTERRAFYDIERLRKSARPLTPAELDAELKADLAAKTKSVRAKEPVKEVAKKASAKKAVAKKAAPAKKSAAKAVAKKAAAKKSVVKPVAKKAAVKAVPAKKAKAVAAKPAAKKAVAKPVAKKAAAAVTKKLVAKNAVAVAAKKPVVKKAVKKAATKPAAVKKAAKPATIKSGLKAVSAKKAPAKKAPAKKAVAKKAPAKKAAKRK